MTGSLYSAAPVLDALFPAGGQQGSSFTLTPVGKLDPDVQLWTDCPSVHFVPLPGKQRQWQVTIQPDAPRGLHLIRAWNAEGTSDFKWFSIGALPEIPETEPNDELGKSHAVEKMPICINGKLDKGGDVDGYAISLKEGQTLVAFVEAYTLGSLVDMMAHIVDDQGVRILTASDSHNLDPVVIFKAPKTATYTLQLAGFAHPPAANVALTGGAAVVYRLHLSNGPTVTELYPAVASSTGKTEVELRGYNLDPKKVRHTLGPIKNASQGDYSFVALPESLQPLPVIVREKAGLTEKEPNDEPAQATPIKMGDSIGGRIAEKDPVDRYALQGKKGDRFLLRVLARQMGSLLDPVLEVLDATGKSLLVADDMPNGIQDTLALWTAPAEGVFQLTIRDRFTHGGENYNYILEAAPAPPTFEATLADGKALLIEPGKTIRVKVNIKLLGGYKEPLVVRLTGLPVGIQAPEVAVPEKGGDVEVKLTAAANAPASSGPIKVTVWTKPADKPETATVQPVYYPLRGENQRGISLLDKSDLLWLTVKAK